ncbi:MAG: sulfurtransferase TusA family protein [Nitrososphaeraceae archaeon]|jgi:tRNA 2-thiouridine synthesizing protein A|nr:sulfurtransferase TusA family protein [Nitrososphaeraceae archaeon]MDW0314872.1 sulfurtransferase TusA family protein [Nitrososphaeraceae archaeon]MDW0331503.1 sulfurtransferase TusA family protein [Nitrososphaeraceae archaeon]
MDATDTKDEQAKTIDVRGLFCPEPVFRTKIEIEKLASGDVLKVLADDPESEEDISRWISRTGHHLLSVNKTQKDLEFVIKKAK